MTKTSPAIISSKNKPIVFFGTEDFSAITLAALIKAGWPVVAVVTKPDSPKGRGHKLTPPRVKSLALQYGIAVWQPKKLTDIADDVKAIGQPVGILVSYGKIVPQAIIDLFSPGIINLHPSLLPKYRGPSPIEAAILNGDGETGVSIMQLSAKMDAGPVYLRSSLPLSGHEAAEDLYVTLGEQGTSLLLQNLPRILNGELQPTSQNDEAATYCKLIAKSDGFIDWHKPAKQLEREIRAYRGWPGSRATLGSIEVIITAAHATSDNTGDPGDIQISHRDNAETLAISTGDGLLYIEQIKPIGKKEMPISAFLTGYKDKI